MTYRIDIIGTGAVRTESNASPPPIREIAADTIMLGCTCMAPVGPDVAAQVNVPVFESMRTGYKTAEALLALGVRHSDAAYPKPNPDNLGAVGALVAGQGNMDLGGDCEVCV